MQLYMYVNVGSVACWGQWKQECIHENHVHSTLAKLDFKIEEKEANPVNPNIAYVRVRH